MTNEEAIRIAQGLITDFKCESETMVDFCNTIIKALEQQPRWIPVSEELPKVADCYAVTEKIGSDLITSVCFFDRPNIWYNDNRINHERNCLTNIVAWMPLPKPYKPQVESEE